MNSREKIKSILYELNIKAPTLAKNIGVVYQRIYDLQSGKTKKISGDVANAINFKYPQFTISWLLDSIIENDQNEKQKLMPIINNEKRGVPYYDVDFIAGYDLVENDQTIIPAYYVDFEPYNKADEWINVTGHSMDPLISHGDKIAVHRIENWDTYILYGEIYAIVTDSYRTIKRVRKSKLGPDYIKLIPINQEYDEQDIPKSIIRKVSQVLGTAKKIF